MRESGRKLVAARFWHVRSQVKWDTTGGVRAALREREAVLLVRLETADRQNLPCAAAFVR